MPSRLNVHASLVLLGCLMLAGCNHSTDAAADADPAKSEVAVGDSKGPADGGAESADSAPLKEPSREYYPTVVLKTSLGEITLKLDAKRAPRTVNNFLHYVQSGHYNQTIFHQVEAGYVVLGGSYTPDLTDKGARYPIPNEANNGLKNVRGAIAMARSPDEIDSATCQFFINLDDNPNLDHIGEAPEEYGFCVFGEVIKGMDVIDQIGELQVQSTEQFEKLPVETVLLETARRVQ